MSHLEELAARLDRALAGADAALAASYPGDRGVRQPVHTVYVPGDRYDEKTVSEWSAESGRVLAEHAGSAAEVADSFELEPGLAEEIYDRVTAKLAAEPIEDLRIDFEDGYGARPDEDEDAAVVAAARALAATVRDGSATPFHGIRIKSFEAPTRHRGLRTLDLFLGELVREGGLGDGFVITLPKVTSVEQVTAMVTALSALEAAHGIEAGSLRFEIQVETPQAILGSDGTALIARMIAAGAGRVTGLHYGTYDYSASLGVAAAFQSMEHPVADHAKDVMQVAAAGTGVFVSDGSTNVLPVGDPEAVRAAWRL
ncbi:aldolase/citrate lyase family protein, partial [Nocardioides sp. NPDC000441]